jgi:gas vesicle protein
LSKNNVAPEAIVSVEEGDIRYLRNETKGLIEISYKNQGEAKYTKIGSFSVDPKVLKEHNGRIKDTFKGAKGTFPSWVYRETLGRTHQDIRNAIDSSVRKQEKAIVKAAEKAQKEKEKAAKKAAQAAKKAAKKGAKAPPVEAPTVDDEEIDELLESAKSELNK